MGKLRYGIVSPRETKQSYTRGTMTASTVLKAKSGRWVTKAQGTDTWNLSTAINTQVDGYDDTIDILTVTSDKHTIYTSLELVVEMPYWNGSAAGTLTAALGEADMVEVCDIYVASDIQYANLGAASTKVLIVVGYDVKNNLVYTKRNPAPATALT